VEIHSTQRSPFHSLTSNRLAVAIGFLDLRRLGDFFIEPGESFGAIGVIATAGFVLFHGSPQKIGSVS
jgi:hypothetical protein